MVKIFKKNNKKEKVGVIICDECQFCTPRQIEELKELTEFVPVLCYGLKTDFRTKLFAGSKRLVEIADSLTELKAICECGRKASINARFKNGKLMLSGAVVDIGGDEKYRAMCYDCFAKLRKEAEKEQQKALKLKEKEQ